jgi:formylglycine-generating enzyme required for sulfatase activity
MALVLNTVQMRPKIFISYSKEQPKPTRDVATLLESAGYEVWWDTNLTSGENFRKVIERELNSADAVIVIWTPQSISSDWVVDEAERARHRRVLITLRSKDVDPRCIPMPYGAYHTDLVDNHDAILAAVRRVAGPPQHETGSPEQRVEIALVTKRGQTIQTEVAAGIKTPNVAEGPGGIRIYANIAHGSSDGRFQPGAGKTQWFKDHELGPEMVVVPPGEFSMGSTKFALEPPAHRREQPVHDVVIAHPFAVGRFAVTFDEWDACVADGGCNGHLPDDKGWGRGLRPVINVSWNDAKAYVVWLSAKTGKMYRLLTEAEREYVTRADNKSDTPFWWGSSITSKQANYDAFYTWNGRPGKSRDKTLPVDSFEANPWGLFNVHGNVWEWVEDVWHDDYQRAPADGSAWVTGKARSQRVVRGGSWQDKPRLLRATNRFFYDAEHRFNSVGFRLARTLKF